MIHIMTLCRSSELALGNLGIHSNAWVLIIVATKLVVLVEVRLGLSLGVSQASIICKQRGMLLTGRDHGSFDPCPLTWWKLSSSFLARDF